MHCSFIHAFSKNSPTNESCSGIGLETTILFAKEGANVLMADISEPALEKALAKVKELVPSAKVETKVIPPLFFFFLINLT